MTTIAVPGMVNAIVPSSFCRGLFCAGATLAESEGPSSVRFAFPCLYPCQPNIGRYWPLFGP